MTAAFRLHEPKATYAVPKENVTCVSSSWGDEESLVIYSMDPLDSLASLELSRLSESLGRLEGARIIRVANSTSIRRKVKFNGSPKNRWSQLMNGSVFVHGEHQRPVKATIHVIPLVARRGAMCVTSSC